jgi:uncharacterized protein involved in exopolysaccharide biosynthesis
VNISEPNGFELHVYLRTLWRARFLLVAGTLVGAAVAFAATRAYPRQFSAVTVLTPKTEGRTVSAELIRPVIGSYVVGAETVSSLHLDEPPYALSPQAFMRDHVKIAVNAGTWNVQVTLGDAKLASDAANRLAASIIRVLTDETRAALETERKYAEERVGRLRARHETLAAAAQEYWKDRGGIPQARPVVSAKDGQGLILTAELDAVTKLYADAFTKYEEIRMETDSPKPVALIIAPAVADVVPSSPAPSVIVALGAVLGLASATALALAYSLVRRSESSAAALSGSSEVRHVR